MQEMPGGKVSSAGCFSAEKARIVRAERLLPLDTEKRYTYSDSIVITGDNVINFVRIAVSVDDSYYRNT